MELAKKTSRELLEEVRFLRLRVRELEEKGGASDKPAGKVLSAAEDLDLFFDSLPDLIAIIDKDHRIVKINSAMAERLGVSPEDAVGEFCYKCVHGEDAPPSFCPHTKLLHDGQRHCQEVQDENLGGTFFVSVSPIRDNQGKTVGSIHVAQDITEEKSSEEKVRFHAQLLDNVRESIIATDLAGQIIYWGKGAETLYHYPSEEMVGKVIYVIDESLDETEEQKRIHDILSKGFWKGQCRQKRRDGSLFWADIIISVVKDSNGQPYGLMRVDRDITEKKKAELALLQSEWSANAILNATLESLFLLDKDGTIRLVNTTGAERFGRGVKELIGQKIYNFFPPDLLEKRSALIEEVIRSGKPIQSEDRRGEMDYLNCIYPVFDHNGKVEGVAVFAGDITHRKRWEQILRNIAEGVSAATGEEFFRSITQYLALTLGTAYAFVGEISGDKEDHIRTIAVYAKGETAENFEYELAGTPCENVVGKKICSYTSDVTGTFPQDDLLRQMGAESYVGAPLFDSSGRPIGIIAVVDTKPLDNPGLAETMLQIFAVRAKAEVDRKHAEEALRESEERFRVLFESAPDAIFLMDMAGIFVDGNNVSEELSGYKKEELIGKNFAEVEILQPEQIETAQNFLIRVFRGETAGPTEFNLIRKDKKRVAIEIRSFPVVIKGQVLSLSIARDVSDRKRAEDALRESEERFRLLYEKSPLGYQSLNSQGYLIEVNPAWLELLGYKRDEVIGRWFGDFLMPRYKELFKERLLRFKSRGEIRTADFEMMRKDGSIISVEIDGRIALDSNGNFIQTHCILHDVTERKRAEEALQKAHEELEARVEERTSQLRKEMAEREQVEKFLQESEKMAAQGQMAARIAHEINNPLAGIKNSFLLVKDAIPKDHKYYEYVGRIEKEISRVGNIVRQMYDLHRTDTEKPAQFRVIEVVDDVVSLLRLSSEELKVKIEVEINDAEAKAILVEGLFRQVLFNLIQNAVEASAEEGIVKVRIDVSDRELSVDVIDQGAGISAEVSDRIFEPFFTTKDGQLKSGLGLGLSVCKSIVDSMGGTIGFESREGNGTFFKVVIPLNQ